jgi:hypothetical protein
MSAYDLLNPAARRLTWATVATKANAMGWTVAPTTFPGEYLATNADHTAAIYADEPEDMLATIRANITHAQKEA